MDINQLYSYIQNEDDLKQIHCDELKAIIDSYPYFQAAIFLYLKLLYRFEFDGTFKEELSRLSIFINDRSALFYYIFNKEFGYFFATTGKKFLAEDKTSLLLNAFFEAQEDKLEENFSSLNFNQTSLASNDYFAYLESSENKEEENEHPTILLKHHQIIDSFLEKSEKEGNIHIHIDKNELQLGSDTAEYYPPDEELSDEELYENAFFSETLARIYVKQKKYDKAYKIIKHLSLNYPKKNIYFADQLNFLEKLIINTKYKEKK